MSKKKFLDLCEKNNVVFTDEGDRVCIDPPDGFHFKSSGLHYKDIYNSHGQYRRSEIYKELADEILDGIEACSIDNGCEIEN